MKTTTIITIASAKVRKTYHLASIMHNNLQIMRILLTCVKKAGHFSVVPTSSCTRSDGSLRSFRWFLAVVPMVPCGRSDDTLLP